MRYPKFLPEKGTIGFVAPSFGCATEPYYTAFLNAQKKFQKMGYGLDLGRTATRQKESASVIHHRLVEKS